MDTLHLTIDEPADDRRGLVIAGQVAVELPMTDMRWNLRNEVRDMRWEALTWLVQERFVLELEDLEIALFNIQTHLSHGEDF